MIRFLFALCLCFQLAALENIEVKFSRRPVDSGEGVTFGLPFEKGKVRDLSELCLTDASGRRYPLQSRVNARWQDGSVKWGLFDTVLSGVSSAALRSGPAPRKEDDLARKEGDVWEIRNGKFVLQVPGKGALFTLNGVPAEWTMSLVGSPGPTQEENWLRDAGPETGGRKYFSASGSPLKVTVEENGPLRASIAVHGAILDGKKRVTAPFVLRLSACKNDPVLRVQNTFVAAWDVNREFLRSMAIRLRFPVKEVIFRGGRIPLENKRFSCAITGTPRFHHLVSWKDEKPQVMRTFLGEKCLSETAAAPAQLKAGGFTFAVLDFHRLYPKELAADRDGLIFGIWPETGGKVLDLRRRAQFRKVYHDYENPWGGLGVAKTHDLFIAVGDVPEKNLATIAQEPLLAGAAPEYYRRTRACGEFMTVNEKMFPRIEALSRFHLRYLRKLRTAGGLDGMMDWGDVPLGIHGAHRLWPVFLTKPENPKHDEGSPFRGYWGWCNGDFAITHGFFLYFFRSGDFKVLRDGIEMSRHIMDVDTVHYLPEKPQFVGLGRRHDQQHWGSGIGYGYAPDAWAYHYLLTGDHRALEVLKETAGSPYFYYGRFVAIRLWEITGEKKYLEKALKNIRDEIDLSKAQPFRQNNFRFNSYDAPGLMHTDVILESPVLREAAVKAAKKFAETWPFPLSHRGHPPYAVLALAAKYAPDDPLVREMMKIRIEMLKKILPPDPAALDRVTDGDPMERFDAALYKDYQQNTSAMSLYIHTALPYMLEQLRLQGIGEEECFKYRYRWVEFPEVREDMVPAKIEKLLFRRQPHDYMYTLKTPLFRDYPGNLDLSPDDMMKYKKAVRRLKLYENGRLIGPVSWRHRLMWQNGTLGFSCWGPAISMTTPDNSHPGKNGRRYTIVYTPEAKWKYEDVPSFREELKTIWPYPDITKVSGEWCASLEHESPLEICVWPEPPELQAKVAAARKRHRFTENGKEISRWRRDQNLIIFRTSDNSDPRKNGRKYVLEYKSGEKK